MYKSITCWRLFRLSSFRSIIRDYFLRNILPRLHRCLSRENNLYTLLDTFLTKRSSDDPCNRVHGCLRYIRNLKPCWIHLVRSTHARNHRNLSLQTFFYNMDLIYDGVRCIYYIIQVIFEQFFICLIRIKHIKSNCLTFRINQFHTFNHQFRLFLSNGRY
ncbi:hypothetical protein D3C76_1333880 [compost metagenome]